MSDTPTSPSQSEPRPDSTTSQVPSGRGEQLADRVAGDGAPLDPTAEATVWIGRTHWMHFAGSLALAMLVVVLASFLCLQMRSRGGVFGIWLVVVAACAVIVGGRILLRVLSCRYRLTDQRLFIERGIFAQTIDQTELIRVDDVRLRKTLANRLLGLGSIEVLSTDVTDREVVIEGVRGPETIAEQIRGNMRTLRRKSLFIEKL